VVLVREMVVWCWSGRSEASRRKQSSESRLEDLKSI